MPTQNVNLTDRHADFLKHSVKSGRYKSASEVVRAGLRLLEDQELTGAAKLAALRETTREAFDRLDAGHGVDLAGDEVDRHLESIRDRVLARRADR